MAKIITVCNQKGGTGKTTTSVNLSHALSQFNKKILIVDMDPQGNASSGVGVNKNIIEVSTYDVLLNKATAKESVIQNIYSHLDIIPCNINLTGAEIELVGVLSRETRLKKALAEVKGEYDYVFIDSPPSLGLLTLNALVASDSILIPIQCEFYALEGVSQLINTLNLVREGLNPQLNIEGVLLTMADFRTNLTSEVIREIKSYFKDKVYTTIIPRNIKLSEAPSYGKPISIYDQTSIGAKKYREFALEFLGEELIESNVLEGEEISSETKVVNRLEVVQATEVNEEVNEEEVAAEESEKKADQKETLPPEGEEEKAGEPDSPEIKFESE